MDNYRLRRAGILVSLAFVMVVFIVAVGALAGGATASDAQQGVSIKGGEPVLIRAGTADKPPESVPPPASFLAGAPKTATINVNYVGSWDAQAMAAFQHAVDIAETLITSTVTINVDATWENLGGTTLGQASTETYFRDFSAAPLANTWYPVALANKLAGTDLDPGFQDINASFNSAFNDWYFGTDASPPGNKFDFVTVVLHEIFHGLGFAGSMKVGGTCGSGLGCWGLTGDPNSFPVIYDHFTENGSGAPLLGFSNFSTALANQLTGGDIYFDGPVATPHNVCQPIELYAPNPWEPGSSYSHLDETVFNGTLHALMTPIIDPGEANHNPGSIALALFEDLAWETTVASPVGADPASAAALLPGPTPTLPPDLVHLPVIVKNGVPCIPIP